MKIINKLKQRVFAANGFHCFVNGFKGILLNSPKSSYKRLQLSQASPTSHMVAPQRFSN